MRTQGKVLRVPNVAPGLIMIQGRQFKFSANTVWKSEVEPTPGLVVNVDLDRDLQVVAVTPVPESQLASEPAAYQPAMRKLKPGSLVARLLKTGDSVPRTGRIVMKFTGKRRTADPTPDCGRISPLAVRLLRITPPNIKIEQATGNSFFRS